MSDELNVYNTVCSGRFTSVERKQDTMSRDIVAIREKIFNGHTVAIEEIQADIRRMREATEQRRRSRSLFVRDIILALLGGGGIISLILTQVLQ